MLGYTFFDEEVCLALYNEMGYDLPLYSDFRTLSHVLVDNVQHPEGFATEHTRLHDIDGRMGAF